MSLLTTLRSWVAVTTTPPTQQSVIEWDLYEARRKLLQAQALVGVNEAELAKACAEVDKQVTRVNRLTSQLLLVKEGKYFVEYVDAGRRTQRVSRIQRVS